MGPVHDSQYRPMDHKEARKVRETCTSYKDSKKFDGLVVKDNGQPPVMMKDWIDIIRDHMIQNGMWDVFQYKDPKSKREFDLIKSMGRFKLKDIKKYIKEKKKTADKYEMANLQMSGQYLLDAISSSVFAYVLTKVSCNDSGPEILTAIFDTCYKVTPTSMDDLKTKLRAIKLSDYPGENILKCSQEIKRISNILDGAGYWDPHLLNSILRVFKKSQDEQFRAWEISQNDKLEEFLTQVQNIPAD